MSRARVDKLNNLLARVQQRRAEPRLFAVRGLAESPAEPPENTNVAASAQAVSAAPSSAAAQPASAAVQPAAAAVQPSAAAVQPASPAAPSTPSSPFEESFADLTASVPPPVLKPAAAAPPEPARPAAQAPVSDAEAPSGVEPARPEELAPVRVAPSPALPFDSAVLVVSQPRNEAVRTFGELLELSLSLRPKG